MMLHKLYLKDLNHYNHKALLFITPEFSTKELNTNIDDVITNLKERGLITGEEGS